MGEVEESSTSLNSKSRPKKLLFPPKIFVSSTTDRKRPRTLLRSVCRQKKVKEQKKERGRKCVCLFCLLSPTTTVTFTTTNTLPPEPNAILT
jgi:hypothetical protein